ncbi:hypothetical protein [Lysobacter gummosus]|uniref:hypothetical protein n=1 Tax=Lysobacter gummosus TaxID=262324 RepID=UPI003644B606
MFSNRPCRPNSISANAPCDRGGIDRVVTAPHRRKKGRRSALCFASIVQRPVTGA